VTATESIYLPLVVPQYAIPVFFVKCSHTVTTGFLVDFAFRFTHPSGLVKHFPYGSHSVTSEVFA